MSLFAGIYKNTLPVSVRDKLQPFLRDNFFSYLLKLKGGKITTQEYTMFVDPSDRKGLMNYGMALLNGHVNIEEFEVNCFVDAIKTNPSATIVDVGANYGMYTLAACQNAGREIICIEPSTKIADCLNKSIGYNGFSDKVHVVNAAVGKQHKGTCQFVEHKTQSSFNYTIFNEQIDIDTQCYNLGPVVETVTLDGVLSDSDINKNGEFIIKIDVEGNEMVVLEGMVETLSTCSGYQLFLEYSTNRMSIVGRNYLDLGEQLFALNPDDMFHLDPKSEEILRIDSMDYFRGKNPFCMTIMLNKNMKVPDAFFK